MAASPSRQLDDSDSRLERFRTFTVAHPRLVEAKEALVNAIRGAEPNSLIFVFGPTGVGKTTLRLKTEQLIIAEMLRQLDDSDSRLERFRTFTVAHPRLVEAKEALVNAIRGSPSNSPAPL